MDYFKDNPSIVCKCGGKFRKFGTDRFGKKREYTQCMNCTISDYGKSRTEAIKSQQEFIKTK